MLSKIKKYHHIIITPLIVLSITCILYAIFGVFPFGKNTVSWCDMTQQTVPLLMNLKDILEGNGSLFYSTGNAGGMNFWGVFLFFLSSPLYLTVVLVEKAQIIYLVNILLAIKLALASLTASVYFYKSHKKLKKELSIVLSVMYGFCGYAIMYCQTLIWLDIMILFPLLIFSIERLCRQEKPVMYGIILSLTMIISFYLSYMIIIYLLIAVPLFIILRCNKHERKRAAFLFLSASLIVALITAPVWLCAFLQISESARGENFLYEIMYKPTFENFVNKFSVLMCTALGIAILPFFIKSKIIKSKKIKYNLILLVFLAIPMIIDPVNKLWHTGSYQSFPLRYGFIIIFTLLILVAEYFEKTSFAVKNSKSFVLTVCIMAVTFIVLVTYVVYCKRKKLLSYTHTLQVNSQAFKLLLALFMFACMIYIICILLQRKKLITSKAISAVFMVVFLGECITSFSVNIGYAVNDGGVLKSAAVLHADTNDNSYYRTKTEKKYLHVNMLGGLGYNSLAHYTSLTGEDYMFAMKKLGYSSYWMEVGSNGGTVLTDALLAVKKSIGTYFDFKSYYDIIDYDGELEIGKSNIYCPVGIIKSESPKDFRYLGNNSRVDTQKYLAKEYFGDSSMIYEYTPDFTSGGQFKYTNSKYNVIIDDMDKGLCQARYTIDIAGNQMLYFDVFEDLSNNLSESYYGAVSIYVNGINIISDYPGQKNNGIINLGEFQDTTAEILIVFKKDISVKSLGIFGIDTDKLKNHINNINGCEFYTDNDKLYAECNINGNDNWLYMSIPYEKGLTAAINGKNTDIIKINDAFCAIKLQDRKNIINIDFKPYGISIAVMLSITGIILLGIYLTKAFNKPVKSKQHVLDSLSLKVVGVMFGGVLILIYIFPVAAKIVSVAFRLLN